MIQRRTPRFFDLSSVIAFGLVAFLLVSMPGGCGDDNDIDDETSDDAEAIAEPTPPPMMDIVEPEPGDLDPPDEPAGDQENGNTGNADDNGAEAAEEDTGAPDGVHVVQQGDTLYGIAVQYSVSMDALMEANNMDDPNQLQVGQELQIPE